MGEVNVRTPFFCVNPKAYLYGEASLNLALEADRLAEKYDLDIFFTCQHADAYRIASKTKRVIVTVQHMDGLSVGTGMGYILPESLKEAGVKAVFLNHAEHPITYRQLQKTIERAKELDLMTIACADSVEEGKAVALLKPTIIVCEPTELIGTGQTSDTSYMERTNEEIRKISPETLVLQAAGISTAEDVKKALLSGADGTGGTSGIVCAESPLKALNEMVEQVVEYAGGNKR